MLYIHDTTCISPQPADLIGVWGKTVFTGVGSEAVCGPVDGVYKVVEPAYPGIAPNTLRRMSKAVRLGVGAAMPLLQASGETPIDGILIGTGNGGMEESVKFLRQIVDYNEGMLAPGHFVQSIPNAIASQIALMNHNRGYNSTYVHRGLAFEHALIDAAMLISEQAGSRFLVGGVDELSGYHYQIEEADGWYKEAIAGEGVALFLVNGEPADALAALRAVETFHSGDASLVAARLQAFLQRQLPDKRPTLFVSGENGDSRALPFYKACEAVLDSATPVARYKHLCGEYPSASAFAVWLALQLAPNEALPAFILLYNNHKLSQHSFMLLQRFR
jgi:hypothetical protein